MGILQAKVRRHASILSLGISEPVIGINGACQTHHYRGAV
jgi:hypothetical protein